MGKLHFLLFFTIVSVFELSKGENKYCKHSFCGNNRHVMCQSETDFWGTTSTLSVETVKNNPPKGFSDDNGCYSWSKWQLTENEKKEIVDYHNELRRNVAEGREKRGKWGNPQPAAKHIPDLEWDEELADIARVWAYQCDGRANTRCSNVERFSVAQNTYRSTVNDKKHHYRENPNSPKDLIRKWYDEVDKFDSNHVAHHKHEWDSRHYVNMIAAKSTKIGCGFIKYVVRGIHLNSYLVCNYGPGGLSEGEPVYELEDEDDI